MNLKEILELQCGFTEYDVIPNSFVLFYIRISNTKERVEKVGVLNSNSSDTIDKIESSKDFVKWCSKEELDGIYHRFAKLMVGRG